VTLTPCRHVCPSTSHTEKLSLSFIYVN
jgi:hypothetical protein